MFHPFLQRTDIGPDGRGYDVRVVGGGQALHCSVSLGVVYPGLDRVGNHLGFDAICVFHGFITCRKLR